MLSKEEITIVGDGPSEVPCCKCGGPVVEFVVSAEIWNALIRENGPETDQEYLCLSCYLKKVHALALLGLQVKEGAKDARKGFECWAKERGLNIDQEIGRPGQYWHSATSRLWTGWEAGAAFALKQRGEVVWEGELPIQVSDGETK